MISHALLTDIYQQLSDFVYAFSRVFSVLIFSPVFGDKSVLLKVKIGLSFFITLVIHPLLSPCNIPVFSIIGFITLSIQIFIGCMLGMLLHIIFYSVRHAGEIISLQMGLSFASFYDLSSGQHLSAISRLLNAITVLLFLSLDAHLLLIELLTTSFHVLPIAKDGVNMEGVLFAFMHSKLVLTSGLSLALPIVILLLCVSLGLGLLNRLSPQLSIFVVGFPISLLLGVSGLCYLLYMLHPFIEHLCDEIFAVAAILLQRLG